MKLTEHDQPDLLKRWFDLVHPKVKGLMLFEWSPRCVVRVRCYHEECGDSKNPLHSHGEIRIKADADGNGIRMLFECHKCGHFATVTTGVLMLMGFPDEVIQATATLMAEAKVDIRKSGATRNTASIKLRYPEGSTEKARAYIRTRLDREIAPDICRKIGLVMDPKAFVKTNMGYLKQSLSGWGSKMQAGLENAYIVVMRNNGFVARLPDEQRRFLACGNRSFFYLKLEFEELFYQHSAKFALVEGVMDYIAISTTTHPAFSGYTGVFCCKTNYANTIASVLRCQPTATFDILANLDNARKQVTAFRGMESFVTVYSNPEQGFDYGLPDCHLKKEKLSN